MLKQVTQQYAHTCFYDTHCIRNFNVLCRITKNFQSLLYHKTLELKILTMWQRKWQWEKKEKTNWHKSKRKRQQTPYLAVMLNLVLHVCLLFSLWFQPFFSVNLRKKNFWSGPILEISTFLFRKKKSFFGSIKEKEVFLFFSFSLFFFRLLRSFSFHFWVDKSTSKDLPLGFCWNYGLLATTMYFLMRMSANST